MSARVLFAFSDTGGGHRSAGLALRAALEQSGHAVECEMLDVLRATDFPGLRESPLLYDKLSTRWLRVYDALFQITDGTRRVNVLSGIVSLASRHNLARHLRTFDPQVVVSVHPLVHRLLHDVRSVEQLPFRLITAVTDLVSLHSSWSFPGVDFCAVPTEEAYQVMLRRKVPAEKLRRTGFPVHPKFTTATVDRAAARQELGVEAQPFTILVTGGGVGSGNLRELVGDLAQAFPDRQLLVVTGKNRAVYAELSANPPGPLVQVYGFVDNMEVLMGASDVVVTKAGPGTLMEALVMRRPVVVTEAVGMQERGNIDFVLNHELGMFCPTMERIISAINQLTDPALYGATVERLEDAVPRDGSAQIAALVLDQIAQVEAAEAAKGLPGRLSPT